MAGRYRSGNPPDIPPDMAMDQGVGMVINNLVFKVNTVKGGHDAGDTRKPHDILLDYLVNLNAKPQPQYSAGQEFKDYLDQVGLTDLKDRRKKEKEVDLNSICVFEEGFAGKDGNPQGHNYWEMAGKGKTPDTATFCHYNEKVRRFFDLGGYRAFPEVVTVQLEVREVFAVDLVRGTFRVAFVVTTRWYDRFFDRDEFFNEEEMYAQSKPYITFDHVDEGDGPNGVPRDAAGLTGVVKHSGKVQRKAVDPPGVLYHSQRVQASFRVQNHLHKFPFDVQHLPLVIRLWGSSVKGNNDHGRILLPLTVNMALAHNHLEWYPYQATSYVARGRFDRQELTMNITLRRIPTFFIWNVYVILFLMPAISFFAFTVPPAMSDDGGPADFVDSYEGRCQITLTLMLTSVAYKFYLSEMLPKAPYLSRMDSYINVSFLTILTIFVANSIVLVVQYYQDDTTWLNLDGRTGTTHTSVAESVDKVFAWCIFTVFSVLNIYQFYLARVDCRALESENRFRSASDDDRAHLGLKDKNKKVGDFTTNLRSGKALSSDETQLIAHVRAFAACKSAIKKEKGLKSHPIGMGTVHLRRARHVELQKQIEASSYFAVKPKSKKHCTCTACVNRRSPLMFPDSALESLCDKAGIPLQKVSSLCRQFGSHNIDLDDLERIFNDGQGADAVIDMLKEIEVPLEERVKLLAVLSKGAKEHDAVPFADGLCAMQGSSSYLMLALGLAGKLVKTNDLIDRLDTELALRMQPGTVWDLGDAANMLYAAALFSSPVLKSEYVYSQRTFDSKADDDMVDKFNKKKNANERAKKWSIPSQVWLGYLDKSQAWSAKKSIGALAVDLGTGKMAFGYAEKVVQPPLRNGIRAIDLSSHQADEPVVKKFFDDLANMSAYLDVGFKANEYPHIGTDEDIAAWKESYSVSDADRLNTICRPIVDQLIAVRDYLGATAGVRLTGREPILFFGTSKLRQWVKDKELVHGGRCTELVEGLGNFIGELLNEQLGTDHAVKFEVIEQAYEAACELRAFQLALEHGELKETDGGNQQTIVNLLKADKVGNIAWGNGSMQGFPDTVTYVCAEMGMNVAKAQLRKFVTVTENAKGKEVFSFDDAAAAKAAIENARNALVAQMAILAPRLPVPAPRPADNPVAAGFDAYISSA